jgi:hypothetical protein
MYKQRIVNEKDFKKELTRYRGGKPKRVQVEYYYLRVQIRDPNHFKNLIKFLNKNVGHGKWTITKRCRKFFASQLGGPIGGPLSPRVNSSSYSLRRTIKMPVSAKSFETIILLM